ncbi:MAG TPA: hypothetical protein VGN55_17180 [Xanthobacteraceae bacterium]
MSEPPTSPNPPMRPQDQSGQRGCLQVFLVLLGLVMLLPGICGVIIVGLDPHELMVDPMTLLAVLGLIAIGVGGIVLIWFALRQPR